MSEQNQNDAFYLWLDGQQSGPHGLDELRSFWKARQVTKETLYWQDGLDEWLPLGTIADEIEPPAVRLPMPPRSVPSARVKVSSTLLAEGVSGVIELHEHKVVIRRRGTLAFLNHGLAGDKEILIAQISSIQFKSAGFTSGFISFAFLGGNESRQGVLQAAGDQNSFMFAREQQPLVEAIKAELERRLQSRHSPAQSVQAHFSPADELEKLARLREKGIVSEAEFQAKKLQLLGI